MRGLLCILLAVGIARAKTPATPNPTLSPKPGKYALGLFVTIQDSMPDANIHYTVDRSEPNDNSPLYTEHIPVRSTTKIRAIAFAQGHSLSKSVTGSYQINGQLLGRLAVG